MVTGSAGFGDRLRAARIRRGLTQAELAGPGVSASYVSLIEAGRRQPTRKAAERLAALVGVDTDELLTGVSPAVHEQRELAVRFAELALLQGEARVARDAFERVLAGELTGSLLWRAEQGLARALESTGHLADAIDVLERLAERASLNPAEAPWLAVTTDLSRCYRVAGDLSRAGEVAERALERARQLGLADDVAFPTLTVTWAAASMDKGDLAHASSLLRRLLESMNEQSPAKARASALWNAALVAGDQGQLADALLLAERALALFGELDNVRATSSLRILQAWVQLEDPQGDASLARPLLIQARSALLDAGLEIEAAYAETELARAEAALGDGAAGVAWARSSLDRLGDEAAVEAVRARLALARALLATGEAAPAMAEMETAAEALQSLSADRQSAAAWRELAELQDGAGLSALAAASFRRALDVLGVPARRVGAPVTADATAGAVPARL
ncbi:MAG: transcriptional regulator [Frankiales bacterium]|nr:transcriptional regulator [Frankiales bacterium]